MSHGGLLVDSFLAIRSDWIILRVRRPVLMHEQTNKQLDHQPKLYFTDSIFIVQNFFFICFVDRASQYNLSN